MSHSPEPAPEGDKDARSDDCLLQWLALVVLLVCWLAEAYV